MNMNKTPDQAIQDVINAAYSWRDFDSFRHELKEHFLDAEDIELAISDLARHYSNLHLGEYPDTLLIAVGYIMNPTHVAFDGFNEVYVGFGASSQIREHALEAGIELARYIFAKSFNELYGELARGGELED